MDEVMVSLVASRLRTMDSPRLPVLPSTLIRSCMYFSYSAAAAGTKMGQ